MFGIWHTKTACVRGSRRLRRTAISRAIRPAFRRLGAREQHCGVGDPLVAIHLPHDEVIHYEAYHRMALLRMAKSVMGEDRSELLMEHTYLGQVYAQGDAIRGFSLALLGEGLILADDPKVGLELQHWHFPILEHLLIPAGNTAAATHLTERGYTATVEGIRMVRGPVPELKEEMVFGWG